MNRNIFFELIPYLNEFLPFMFYNFIFLFSEQSPKTPKDVFVNLCRSHKFDFLFSDAFKDKFNKFHCKLTATSTTSKDCSFTANGCSSTKKTAEHHACLLVMKQMVESNLGIKVVHKLIIPDKFQNKMSHSELDPMSRLCQISQAKKIDKPKFETEIIEENNFKFFVTTCSMMDLTVTEKHSSKKGSKVQAASSLLQKIGFNLQNPNTLPTISEDLEIV